MLHKQNPQDQRDEQAKLDLVHEALQGRITQKAFTRRAVLMGISAATVGAVLAACNGGGAASSGANGTFTATSGANKGKTYTLTPNYKPGTAKLEIKLGAEKPGPIYREGYVGPKYREIEKFGDGTTEFTIVAAAPLGMDYTKNGFSKFLEETTGVKIKYKSIPYSGSPAELQTKFNALMAAGDLPDAFMLGPEWVGGVSLSQAYSYGAAGVFLPVDELIDKYSPYAQEVFEQIPGFRDNITAPDGKIYGYPGVNDCYHCKSSQQRAWINSDWLKKVGMPVPKTTAEFEATLQAFKDKNPSGLPKALPASGYVKDGLIDYLMTGFLFSNPAFGWLALNQGKVELVVTKPEYRKGLTWVSSLFEKGLIDKNIFTQDQASLQALTDNKGGCLIGMAGGGIRGSFSTRAKFGTPDSIGFEPLLPLKGPDGVQIAAWDEALPPISTNVLITSKCKDPATLVRWCDAQLDLYLTLQQAHGKEGEGWNWSKAGETGINGKQALYTMIPVKEETANDPTATYAFVWNEIGVFNLSNDVRLGEATANVSVEGGEAELYRIGKSYEPFRQPEGVFLRPLSFDVADATNIAQLKTNIENFIWQQFAAFCTGKKDPANDGDWKAFTDGLTSQQLPQYLSILQTAYDKTLKK